MHVVSGQLCFLQRPVLLPDTVHQGDSFCSPVVPHQMLKTHCPLRRFRDLGFEGFDPCFMLPSWPLSRQEDIWMSSGNTLVRFLLRSCSHSAPSNYRPLSMCPSPFTLSLLCSFGGGAWWLLPQLPGVLGFECLCPVSVRPSQHRGPLCSRFFFPKNPTRHRGSWLPSWGFVKPLPCAQEGSF